jgi:hypothetical protein
MRPMASRFDRRAVQPGHAVVEVVCQRFEGANDAGRSAAGLTSSSSS